jgi:amino acid transporter
MNAARQRPESTGEASLARRIGLWGLVVYGVGDMLGSGIYALVGKAAGVAGNALWLAFVVSLVAALLTALSYASLGSRYPRAAGAAYVAQRAFGVPLLTYLLGLSIVASGLTSLATQSHAFTGYLLGLTGASPALSTAIALGFIAALSLINFWGIRESTAFNAVCTAVEIAGLAVVLVVGFSYWGSVNYLQTPASGEASPGLLSPVLQASVLTFYAFIGFEDMINVSEEVKEPRKNFPLAVILAMGITALLYIAICITVVSVVPYATLARSQEPLVEVVAAAAPWFPEHGFALIALFAIANTGLINYVMGSRMVYGLARQGLVPEALGKVHPKRRTPHRAILALMLVVTLLALSGGLVELASATSALLLLVFIVVNSATLVLKRRPDEPRGAFEIPSFIPLGGALSSAILLTRVSAHAWLTALGVMAGIVLLYVVLRPKQVLAEPD